MMRDFWVSVYLGNAAIAARCFSALTPEDAVSMMQHYLTMEFLLPADINLRIQAS